MDETKANCPRSNPKTEIYGVRLAVYDRKKECANLQYLGIVTDKYGVDPNKVPFEIAKSQPEISNERHDLFLLWELDTFDNWPNQHLSERASLSILNNLGAIPHGVGFLLDASSGALLVFSVRLPFAWNFAISIYNRLVFITLQIHKTWQIAYEIRLLSNESISKVRNHLFPLHLQAQASSC